MREIPKKNYIILLFLVLGTVLLTLLIAKIYLDTKSQEKSYISTHITNINTHELDSYLQENSLVLLYISDEDDLDNKEFEKKFVEELNHYDIKKYFIFLNLNEENKKYIEKHFNEIIEKPIVLIIEDGVITYDPLVNDSLINSIMSRLYLMGVVE